MHYSRLVVIVLGTLSFGVLEASRVAIKRKITFVTVCEEDDYERAKKLLKEGADVDEQDDFGSSLHYAIQNDNDKLARLLLDQGANINAKSKGGFTALHVAAELNLVSCIALLVTHKASVNETTDLEFTPLHYAARNGNTEACKALLEHKADLEAAGYNGFSPLVTAVLYKHFDTARFLFSKGAKVMFEALYQDVSDQECVDLIQALSQHYSST